MKEILVKTLMSTEISSISPETPLQEAVQLMVEQCFSCVVVQKSNIPVGIVTERDLVKVLNRNADNIDLNKPVAEFMSFPIFSLNQNASLFDAMVVSRAERIRHLPVVDDDESLVGLVTQTDLANAHFRVIEIQTEIIEKTVALKTDELNQVNAELQALSTQDHLMQIGNRRAMEVDLGHTHNTSVRYGHPYSVLLMDIDFFKLYNDRYGHLAGDEALQSVAEILKSIIRGSDRLYRYGGEELLLVLPNTNGSQAEKAARKLVSAVFKKAIPHDKSNYEFLSISCGGACAMTDSEMIQNWQALVELADNNLYKAKNNGRNCVVVSKV